MTPAVALTGVSKWYGQILGLADVDPNREPYLKFRDVFGVTL